ncbi:protein-arginine deiminase family protein [Amycolatopsis anabasis]|uniref:protein-arginine deiminase family protein n=1 Tax=Amycolatopsis anabasis TaxID=1840409 RepID=UPI00131B1B29|nr:protein-arginine deiminase family protein [Amycolatopsis anabasis]
MRIWGIVTALVVATTGPFVAAEASGAPELRGATIMLPNLDDDQRRCRVEPDELEQVGTEVDRKLAACNDAADDRVNGPADEADLARVGVRARPGLSDRASGVVRVEAPARIFVRRDGEFRSLVPGDGTLSAAELRSGVELAVEGRDIVRDPARWDGWVTVSLTVEDRGRRTSARHRMRVAPLLLQNDLQRAETVLAGRPGSGPGSPPGGLQPGWVPGDWDRFSSTLSRAARAAGAETRFIPGTPRGWTDVWWQDLFEPAVASMPTRWGVQTMRVAIRSANLWNLPGPDGKLERTLRPAGRLLFRDLRGPDVAVVQEFTDSGRDIGIDLLNATGNIESLPPYRGYPLGRIVYGSGAPAGNHRRPDPAFVGMLAAQGKQPPLVIDTSWLAVGHADETLHVVRADNARGWTLLVADPRLAEGLLRQARDRGAGSARLFAGTRAEVKPSVDEVLGDARLLAENSAAARHIDGQISSLLAETGLRADELVRVPVLFRKYGELPVYYAYTPGIPNGISLSEERFAAPDPHGVVVGGRDLFREAAEVELRRVRVRVDWVEDFSWAHLGGGEVHCTTNAWREVGYASSWWSFG